MPTISKTNNKKRTSSETILLQQLFHVGFSKAVLSAVKIREDGSAFGLSQVESCWRTETDQRTLAWRQNNWPTKPSVRLLGNIVTSINRLIEISILSSAMYYLFGERVYEGLEIEEVLEAYDLYTNLRKTAGNIELQITPDSAYYISREFSSHVSAIPYCPSCNIRYYSSVNQCIQNACPYCREPGVGDFAANG